MQDLLLEAPQGGAYGIDIIKRTLKVILETSKELKDDFKDRHLSIVEAVGLIGNARDLSVQAKQWRALYNEVLDLTSEETEEIAIYLVDEGVATKSPNQIQWAIKTIKLVAELFFHASKYEALF